MNRRRRSHAVIASQHGFTLLELLIAISIVAALLAIAFGGLRVGLAAWRQGEDRAEAHQHVRGVTHALARVLSGAYPYTASRAEAPDPQILFKGEEHRVEVVTQSPPTPFALPIAFAAVVIERTDGEPSGLVVKQRPMPNRDPFTEAVTVLQDPTVTDLTFGYLDEEGAWQTTWDGAESKSLPRAIRLSVTANIGGRSQALPPFTISLHVVTP